MATLCLLEYHKRHNSNIPPPVSGVGGQYFVLPLNHVSPASTTLLHPTAGVVVPHPPSIPSSMDAIPSQHNAIYSVSTDKNHSRGNLSLYLITVSKINYNFIFR